MIASTRFTLRPTSSQRSIASRLEPPVVTSMRQAGRDAETVAPSFVARFGEAYRAQLTAWVDAAAAGRVAGATAWDGYVAGLVADAGVASLRTGERVPVELPAKP